MLAALLAQHFGRFARIQVEQREAVAVGFRVSVPGDVADRPAVLREVPSIYIGNVRESLERTVLQRQPVQVHHLVVAFVRLRDHVAADGVVRHAPQVAGREIDVEDALARLRIDETGALTDRQVLRHEPRSLGSRVPVEQLSSLEVGVPAAVRIVLEVGLQVHVPAEEGDRVVEVSGVGDVLFSTGQDGEEHEACHAGRHTKRRAIHVAPLKGWRWQRSRARRAADFRARRER